MYYRIHRERRLAAEAEHKRAQEQQLNKMNMSFFANVSHEFRTPLTLIAGPVAELADSTALDQRSRRLLNIVSRNVDRMQRLINQLLDFNRLENDALRLDATPGNVVAEIAATVGVFRYKAQQKGITITTLGLEEEYEMTIDADKIEKIIYNLMSNALKFTPDGGRIEVAFDVVAQAEAYATPAAVAYRSDRSDPSGRFSQSDKSSRPDQPDSGAYARKHILVVDDDIEIANYIKDLLAADYCVSCKYSAVTALAALPEFQPDLLISDIVMPDGSGLDLCNQIKNDTQLCHVPIILLTAKTSVQEQVAGLNTGADAYVTKPFEPIYLTAVVRSILDNRDRLSRLLATTTSASQIAEETLMPQDKAFMEEIYRIMEDELNDSELDIAHVSDQLRISRTKLYYKLKALTGQTPAAFFKIYKLNRAAELLREGRYNVSEVADITGFSTLSHFSNSFKRQFGVSPSDFPS